LGKFFDLASESPKNCILLLLTKGQNTVFGDSEAKLKKIPKTQLGGLLTLCRVNLKHELLLNRKNSGRRYILKT
jgi:hypothetical protein